MNSKQPSFIDIFVKRAFLDPLQSPLRIKLYLAAVLGNIAFSGMILYLALDFYAHGALVLAIYLLTKSLFGNIFLMPFLFFLKQRIATKNLFKYLITLQTLALGGLMFTPLETLSPALSAGLYGFMFAIFSAPFWIFYHVMMIHSASDENLGNDVSVGNLGISIGSIFGYVLGGIITTYMPGTWYVLSCFAVMVFSSALLAFTIPIKEYDYGRGSILQSLTNRPWRTLNTVLDGSYNFLTSFFAPVWLGFLGLTSLVVGAASAINVFLKVFISPITGHWIHTTSAQESKVGAGLMTAGWLPWLFSFSPWFLTWSYLLWGAGGYMYAVGLQSRWYEEKTYANMGAREIGLGLGRALACIISIPLIYWNLKAFFIFALLMTALIYVVSVFESKN